LIQRLLKDVASTAGFITKFYHNASSLAARTVENREQVIRNAVPYQGVERDTSRI
jgi:hypothetical protein